MTGAGWRETCGAGAAVWRSVGLGVFDHVFEPWPLACARPEGLDSWAPVGTSARLVFVQGVYAPELSRLDGLDSFCQIEPSGAVVLSFPDDMCLASQVVDLVLMGASGAQAAQASVRLTLRLGAHARVTLLERHIGVSDGVAPFAHEMEKKIYLGPQAKLVHLVMTEEATGSRAGASPVGFFASTQAHVAAGAYYDVCRVCAEPSFVRESWTIHLDAEMAQARFHAVALLASAQQLQVALDMRHHAPNGTSQQTIKTVLKDNAKAYINGGVVVAPQAQKTEAHQVIRGLLLSDRAVMQAVPSLEIYADDVICGHGCAIGDLDPQQLFYMRSRGISESEARFLLIEAFLMDIVNSIQDAALRSLVEAQLKSCLASFSSP